MACIVEPNKKYDFDILIKNTSQEAVVFSQCEMLKRIRVYRLDDDKKVTEMKPYSIQPGMRTSIVKVMDCSFVNSYYSNTTLIIKGWAMMKLTTLIVSICI